MKIARAVPASGPNSSPPVAASTGARNGIGELNRYAST